ncbi:MAG: metallophosphoesterase family protein [Bacteroidales bacterium]|nr:metallophosphoesterase family protein [Bacteroidales bacterium]
MRIGILSDTHGTIPQQVYSFFAECDELWHAGDIGIDVLDKLREFKPVVAVFGNMDCSDMHHLLPQTQLFQREGHKIIMTHIGGYPGHYDKHILPLIIAERPDIFVCGHSHILRIMYDKGYDLLHINPGAAGRQGFHRVATLVRLTLDDHPKDLEICEFDKY